MRPAELMFLKESSIGSIVIGNTYLFLIFSSEFFCVSFAPALAQEEHGVWGFRACFHPGKVAVILPLGSPTGFIIMGCWLPPNTFFELFRSRKKPYRLFFQDVADFSVRQGEMSRILEE